MNLKMVENRVRGPTFKLLAAMNIPVYQAKDVKVNINSPFFYQIMFYTEKRFSVLIRMSLIKFLGNKTLITDSCQSLCPATCAELSRQTDCVKKCSDETLEITGCFCTGNLLLQDGVCVSTDKCRCSHRGKELIPV